MATFRPDAAQVDLSSLGDHSHPALAQLFLNPVTSQHATRGQAGCSHLPHHPRHGAFQFGAILLVEQALDFAAQFRIPVAGGVKIGAALCLRFLQSLPENLLDPRPAVRRHADSLTAF